MLRKQFTRYLTAGAFNTTFGYGVYVAMVFLGLGYAASSAISFVCSVLLGFVVTGRYVFSQGSVNRFLHYILAYFTIYLLYLGLLSLFVGIGLNEYLAGIAAVPPMVATSYVILRVFVFPASRQ